MAGVSASMFFIPYKLASFLITPLPFIFMTYIFSSLFNGIYLAFSLLRVQAGNSDQRHTKGNAPKFVSWQNTIFVGIIFGVLSVFGNYAIGRSLEGTNAGLSAIVLRFQVILVMLMGIMLLKERLHFSFIAGLILSIAGFVILEYEQTKTILEISPFTWALTAAFSFSSVQIILKIFIHKIDPVLVNSIRLLSGIVLMLCLPSFWMQRNLLALEHIYLALIASFFGPFLSRNLQMFAMKHIPVSEFILFSMTTPVLIIFLSWVFLGETPSMLAITGGFIILGGVSSPVLYNIWEEKNSRKENSLRM